MFSNKSFCCGSGPLSYFRFMPPQLIPVDDLALNYPDHMSLIQNNAIVGPSREVNVRESSFY